MASTEFVAWSDGLLVSAHHLQEHDRVTRASADAKLAAAEPWCWGIADLRIDAAALRNGELRVLRLSAITPGGLLLDVGSDATSLSLPSRPVEGAFGNRSTPLTVYVAARRSHEGAPDFLRPTNGSAAPFEIHERLVRDRTGESDATRVAMARPQLRLMFEGEDRDGYDCLAIAQVVRAGTAGFELVEPFVAPSTRIGASPFLMAGLQRVTNAVLGRRNDLAGAQRERGKSVRFHGSDITRFLLLHALNGSLPLLRHLLETGDAHPREAYREVARLAGGLTTFVSDRDAAQLPPYDHANLRETFESLFAVVTACLHGSIDEQFERLELSARNDGMHLGTLTEEVARCRRFFLSVRSPMVSEQVGRQLPQYCKIASWDDIQGLLSAASPGAQVEWCARPPAEIPTQSGTTYFSINASSSFWDRAVASRRLAVYLPAPFNPSETGLQLLALPD